MSKPTGIDLTARLWRNGSDGEPQLTVTLPDGSKAWVRIPRISAKAYAACVAALEAAAEEPERRCSICGDPITTPPYPADATAHGICERMDDFDWHIVGHVELSEPEAEEGKP